MRYLRRSMVLVLLLIGSVSPSYSQPSGVLGKISNSDFMSGGTQSLDHFMYENVHMRHVMIIYAGGPTVLKNVVFEDCYLTPLVSPSSANQRKLQETLLGKSPTTLEFSKNVSFLSLQ